MSSLDNSPALHTRLVRELGQRLIWGGFSYALFAFLLSLNLAAGARRTALFQSALLALLGGLRTLLAYRVVSGRDVARNGSRLIHSSMAQCLFFGAFLAYALWQVRGQVILECLLMVGAAGTSTVAASLFAPFPRVGRFNVCVQVLPVYIWAFCSFSRYGWLLEAFILIHAGAVFQVIRIHGAHIREMFLSQLMLEAQGEDLGRARDAAEKAGSAKMRFLANMSHEIRTPLNGILGLAEVLNGLALTPEQRELIDDIGDSGRHLLSIVNDILDIAKVNSGKLLIERVSFDLSRLMVEIASPVAALAEAAQLRFRLQLSPDLPSRVIGDSMRIRQILSNLLGNAVKFTPHGEVRLTVRTSGPGRVCFEIFDTGLGLTPEQIECLFQEFYQVDSSTTRRLGGTGLGLAISNRLAELMEGRIWVESRLHEGSTFFFEVPLTFEVPLAAAETPATGVAKEPVASPALPSGLRVLVAEDNPINQKVIARIAALAGSLVDIAENGEVAVERHQSSPYDLILMDCQMPVLDGYEATARIRALPGAASRVPIIGVTANAFAEDRDRCLRVGMDHYLAKPLSREALLAAMSRFAGVREVIAD